MPNYIYNPALERLRKDAEKRLYQKRLEIQERYKMRSLLDPLLNQKGREKLGGDNWFDTTIKGYQQLFDSNYLEWFRSPGQALINNLQTIGTTLDYAANLVKAPILAVAKGENVGDRLLDAYGLGDNGRIDQNMSELREVIGAPASGVIGGTAMGALIGLQVGGPWGALIGAGVGLVGGSVAGIAGYYDVDIANTLIDVSLEYSVDPMNVAGALKGSKIFTEAAENAVKSADEIAEASQEVFSKAVASNKALYVKPRTTAQQAMQDFFNGARENIDADTIKQCFKDDITERFKDIDDTLENLAFYKAHMDDAKEYLEFLKSQPDPDINEINKAAAKLRISRERYVELSKHYKSFRGVHRDWEIERSIPIEKRKAAIVKKYNKRQKDILKSYYEGDFDAFSKNMVDIGMYKNYTNVSDDKLKHVFNQLKQSANTNLADKFIFFIDKFDNKFSKLVVNSTPPFALSIIIKKVFKYARQFSSASRPWERATDNLYEDAEYEEIRRGIGTAPDSTYTGPLYIGTGSTRYSVVPKGVVPDAEVKTPRSYSTPDVDKITVKEPPEPKATEPKEVVRVSSDKEYDDYNNFNSVERNQIFIKFQQELKDMELKDGKTKEYYIKRNQLKDVPLGDLFITVKEFESNIEFLIRSIRNSGIDNTSIEALANDPEVLKSFNKVMEFAMFSGETGYDIFLDYISKPNYDKLMYNKVKEVYGEEAAKAVKLNGSNAEVPVLLGTLFSYIVTNYKNNSAIKKYTDTLDKLSKEIESKHISISESTKLVNDKYQELSKSLKEKFKDKEHPTGDDIELYHKIQDQLASGNKESLIASEYALSLADEIDACASAESKLAEIKTNLHLSIDYFTRGYNRELKPNIDYVFKIDQTDRDIASQYFNAITKHKMKDALDSDDISELNTVILKGVNTIIDNIGKDRLSLRSFGKSAEVITFTNTNSYASQLYSIIRTAEKRLNNIDDYVDNFNKNYKLQLDFYDKHVSNYKNHIIMFNNIIKVASDLDRVITEVDSEKSKIISKEIFNNLVKGSELKHTKGKILEAYKNSGLKAMLTNQYIELIYEISKFEPLFINTSITRIFSNIKDMYRDIMTVDKPIHIYRVINSVNKLFDANKPLNKELLKMFKAVFNDETIFMELEGQIYNTFKLYEDIGECILDNYNTKSQLVITPKLERLIKNFKHEADILYNRFAVYTSYLYLTKATSANVIHNYTSEYSNDIMGVLDHLNKAVKTEGQHAVDIVASNILNIFKNELNRLENRMTSKLESKELLSHDKINIFINDGISVLKYLEITKSLIKSKDYKVLYNVYRDSLINTSYYLISATDTNDYQSYKLLLGKDYNEIINFIDDFIKTSLLKVQPKPKEKYIIQPSDLIKTVDSEGNKINFASEKYFRTKDVIDYNGLNFSKLDVNAIRLTTPFEGGYRTQSLPNKLKKLSSKLKSVIDIETTLLSDKNIIQLAYKDTHGFHSLLVYTPDYDTYGYDNLLDPAFVNGVEAMQYNPYGYIDFLHNKAKSVSWTDNSGANNIMFYSQKDLAEYLYSLIKDNIQTIDDENYLVFIGQNSANFDSKHVLELLNKHTKSDLAGIITIDTLYTIRSYTAVGTIAEEIPKLADKIGNAKYFANLPNAKQEEVHSALIERGAINTSYEYKYHIASDDVKATEDIYNLTIGDNHNTLGEAIDAVNQHIDLFNRYWISKIEPLVKQVKSLLNNLERTTYAEDRIIAELDHLDNIDLTNNFNKGIYDIYAFTVEIDKVVKKIEYDTEGLASSSGEYEAPHLTPQIMVIKESSDDLQDIINKYVDCRNRIMQKTYGDALVQPQRNKINVSMEVLNNYIQFRNNPDAIKLQKIFSGEHIVDEPGSLIDIINNYVHRFNSIDQFNNYNPNLKKFYNYQSRVDAYYNFMADMYEYYNKALDRASKSSIDVDKVHTAFNSIHTILYGSSKSNLSYDNKMLKIVSDFDSLSSLDDLKTELSQVVSLTSDNSLIDAAKIIDPDGNMLDTIAKYITNCIDNIDKYNLFSISHKGKTILKPVMDGVYINMYYNAINKIIGVMKDVTGWSPDSSDILVDNAVNTLKHLIEVLRMPLISTANTNRNLKINGAVPSGYVASLFGKNIYDINNGGYSIAYVRTKRADEFNSIKVIEDSLLNQLERDTSGVSDVIEYQPNLSAGKKLIKELILDSRLTLNEIMLITNYFKLDNIKMLDTFSELYNAVCKHLDPKVEELFAYYRNYLKESQRLDVELMDKFKKYIKCIIATVNVTQKSNVRDTIESYIESKKLNLHPSIHLARDHARMDAFNESQIYVAPSDLAGFKKYYINNSNDEIYEEAYLKYYNDFKERYIKPMHIRVARSIARSDAFRDAFIYVFKPEQLNSLNKQTREQLLEKGLEYFDEYEQQYNDSLSDLFVKYKHKFNHMEAARLARMVAREFAYQELYKGTKGINIELDAAKIYNKYMFSDTVGEYRQTFEKEFKAEYDDFISRHKARADFYNNLRAEREGASSARADAYKNVFDEEYRTHSSYYDPSDNVKDSYQKGYNDNYNYYKNKYEQSKQKQEQRKENYKKERIDEYIDRLLKTENDILTNALKSLKEYKSQIISLFKDPSGHINWEAMYKYINNNNLNVVVMYKTGNYRNSFTKQINGEIHTVHVKNAKELEEFMLTRAQTFEFSILDKPTLLDLRKMVGHTGDNRYYKSHFLNNLVGVRKFISYYIMAPLKQFSLYNLGFTVTNALEGFIKTAISAGGNPLTIIKHYQTAIKLHKEYIDFSRVLTQVLEGSPFWRMKDSIKVLQYEQELGKLLFKNWENLYNGISDFPIIRTIDEMKELIALHGSSIKLPNYIKSNILKGVKRGNIDFDSYAKRYMKISQFVQTELPNYDISNYYFVNEFIRSSASASDFQNIIIAEDLDKVGEKAKGIKKYYKKYLFSDNWLGDKNPLKHLTPYANLARNSNIETVNRLALYLSYGEQGFYKNESLANVLTAHFNYGNKSQAEMGAELLYPFISYPLRNYMYWMEVLANNPALIKTFIDFTLYNWGDEKDNVYNQTKITKGGVRLWEDVSIESGFSGYDAMAFGGNALNVLNQRKLNPAISVMIEGAKQLITGQSQLDYRFKRMPLISHVNTGADLIGKLASKSKIGIYDYFPSVFNEVYKNNRYYYNTQGKYAYMSAYSRLYYANGQARAKSKNAAARTRYLV